MKPTIPPGTICLWKGKLQRTVVASSPGFVVFPIRRRSWTNRAITTYSVGECLSMGCIFLDKKTKFPILKSELILLQKIGFDPKAELKRELKEKKEYCKRRGRPVCAGFKRLSSLVSI
jgi:hypothetical protein